MKADGQKKVIEKYGLQVILDKTQVFPDDPGQGTPAMVYNERGASATLTCAMNEGELDNSKTGYMNQLTEKQVDWLWEILQDVELFLYGGVENG